MPTCRKCGQAAEEGDRFCEACGEPLAAGAAARPSPGPGSRLLAEHRKRIRHARGAILAVALLFLAIAIVSWLLARNATGDGQAADPIAPGDGVPARELLVGVLAATGLAYLGLFFWARRNPFAASLVALVLFLTNQIAGVAIDPGSLLKGIVLNVLVVFLLVHGIRSGLAWKKIRDASAA